jgi:hypothetical protein
MQSRTGMTRIHLATAAAPLLLLLSACTMAVPFDVSSGVSLQGPPGAYAVSEPFDLSAEGDLWSQRDKIDAVTVDEVLVTVLSLGPAQSTARATLTLALRAEGAPTDGSQDLRLPPLELAFVSGQISHIPGSVALDAFLLAALHGDGHFTLVVSGTLDGAADAVLQFAIKGRASYKAG